MTDKDQVRLLISDVGGDDNESFIFTDIEIETFISLGGSVLHGAALALRTIANNTAQVLKVIKFMELNTNGAETAKQLLKAAEELEKRADENDEGAIDIIEMNLGPFSENELVTNRWKREG